MSSIEPKAATNPEAELLRKELLKLEDENIHLKELLKLQQADESAEEVNRAHPVLQLTTLNKSEREIYLLLSRHFGKFISSERIFQHLYGARPNPPGKKVLDVYICRLRKALSERDREKEIRTSHGHGWGLFKAAAVEDFFEFRKLIRLKLQGESSNGVLVERGVNTLTVWVKSLRGSGLTPKDIEYRTKAHPDIGALANKFREERWELLKWGVKAAWPRRRLEFDGARWFLRGE